VEVKFKNTPLTIQVVGSPTAGDIGAWFRHKDTTFVVGNFMRILLLTFLVK